MADGADILAEFGGAGGLGEMLGGLYGGHIAERDYAREREFWEKAISQILQERVEAGPSGIEKFREDPLLAAAQRAALGTLAGEARAGGLGIQERAALEEARAQEAQRASAEAGAIREEFRRRAGRGGTAGQELAARLSGQQARAQRGALMGVEAAAGARQRALQAVGQYGGMAGEVRGQEFGQAAQAAQLRDAIERFNAQQRLERSKAVAGLYTGKAGLYGEQAERNVERAKGIGGAIGKVGSFVAGLF